MEEINAFILLKNIRDEANAREAIWEEESIETIITDLENNVIKVFAEDFMVDLSIQANDSHCPYLRKTVRYSSESVKSQIYNTYGIDQRSTLWKRIPNRHDIFTSNGGHLFYLSSFVSFVKKNNLEVKPKSIASEFPMVEIKVGTNLQTYNQALHAKKLNKILD